MFNKIALESVGSDSTAKLRHRSWLVACPDCGTDPETIMMQLSDDSCSESGGLEALGTHRLELEGCLLDAKCRHTRGRTTCRDVMATETDEKRRGLFPALPLFAS